jgi:RNA polymerase sigma-32 factor
MQKRLAASDYSLDAPITRGDDSALRHEFFIDEQAQSIDDLLSDEQIKRIFHAHLREFKDELSPRDYMIFQERLMSDNPLTLQEIGDKFGITRERARQIEAGILKKLKKFVQDKGTLDLDSSH